MQKKTSVAALRFIFFVSARILIIPSIILHVSCFFFFIIWAAFCDIIAKTRLCGVPLLLHSSAALRNRLAPAPPILAAGKRSFHTVILFFRSAGVSRLLLSVLLFLSLSVPLMQGCSMERRAQLAHLKGAVAWKQGDWNTAVMYFCEAEDLAALVSDPGVRNYTDFALASSYLMQREQTAASEKLRTIPDAAETLVRAYSFYQQGIISFQAKEYADAAASFKKALELSGADMDAKINYELSKKLCEKQQELQRQASQNAAELVYSDSADSIILDIIRKREQAEWKKLQRESEPSINDY